MFEQQEPLINSAAESSTLHPLMQELLQEQSSLKLEKSSPTLEQSIKDKPLNYFERIVLSSMSNSIESGDYKQMQEGLQALANAPESANRVLGELRKSIYSNHPGAPDHPKPIVSWEQGSNDNGQNFVRLRMVRLNNDGNAVKIDLNISNDRQPTATNEGRPYNVSHAMVQFSKWISKPVP